MVGYCDSCPCCVANRPGSILDRSFSCPISTVPHSIRSPRFKRTISAPIPSTVVAAASAAVESVAYELRLESSSAAVLFSEPCLCCNSKKRRCLHPPFHPRKKLLVFDQAPPSSNVSSPEKSCNVILPMTFPSASSSGPLRSFFNQTAEILPPDAGQIAPMSPPPPFPVAAQVASPDQHPEGSNPISDKVVVCIAEELNKVDFGLKEEEVKKKKEERESYKEVRGGNEVWVRIECKCGTVREFIL